MKVQLAASTPNPLMLGTTKAGGAIQVELIGHTIEWEAGCASQPVGCGPGIEIYDEFARSDVLLGDRLHLHLQMRGGPGIR